MAEGQFVLYFEVNGDVQVARGFSRFANDVKDLSPAFREIADNFHAGEQKQFVTGGSYGAGGWPALAESTLIRKARQGYPTDILIRTHRLLHSLAGKTGDTIEQIQPLELRMGTKVPYARFHQAGTGRMPARLLIQLPEQQKTEWHKIIQRQLVEQAKERGLL